MNKIFRFLFSLLSIVLLSQSVKAQSGLDSNGYTLGDNESFQQLFDSLTTGLIPSRVPYGALYDRVLSHTWPPEWHNGDTVSKYSLFQDWWDMEHCRVGTTTEGTYEAMRRGVDTQSLRNRLPILYINYDVAYFDTGSISDGRLSIINGIYRDNNLVQIPYSTATRQSIGLPIDRVNAGTDYTIMLDTAHYSLSNNSRKIQSITITDVTATRQEIFMPGDEGVWSFAETDSGLHQFSIEAQLDDASVLSAIQFINILPWKRTNGNGAGCDPIHRLVESDILFQGYGTDESYPTSGWGDYHIYYHNLSPTSTDCEPVLRKPIIILDGYDPQDGRDYADIYKNYLSYGLSTRLSAADELRQKGYDVIILNFPKVGELLNDVPTSDPAAQVPSYVHKPSGGGTVADYTYNGRDGGTDYIERNAFVLVKLIQQINDSLITNGSNEKLVVIGPSMGGQISRYALAYMEKQYANGNTAMNPNTRLWVSFDSPHWGANVPLCDQQTLHWFGNEGSVKAMDSYNENVDTKAGRQLLIEQLGYQNSTHPFRKQYLINLQSNGLAGSYGWPSYRAPGGTIRKIALLNGNGAGIRDFSEGEQTLSGTGFSSAIKVFELNTNFLGGAGQSGQYFQGRYAQKLITYFPFHLGWYRWGLSISSQSIGTTNLNSNGSMDVVPGSNLQSTTTIQDSFDNELNNQGVSRTWTRIVGGHTFIPTVSALGFIDPDFDWNTPVNDRNLICSGEIPFDEYYLPTQNEAHITLTSDNVVWLKKEIDSGQSNCPIICANEVTASSRTICSGSTVTYYLDATPPSGTTTTWWVSDASLQILSSTNNSVTVSAVGNSANCVLTAFIVNPCGANKYVNISLIVGAPISHTVTFYPPNNDCIYTTNVTPFFPDSYSYEWSTNGSSFTADVNNTGPIFIQSNYSALTRTAYCRVTNACTANTYSTTATIPKTTTMCNYRTTNPNTANADIDEFVVSPNPSSNDWKLNSLNKSVLAMNITLTDINGLVIYSKKYENTDRNNVVIPNNSLVSGVYFLKITTDFHTTVIKVIKN